MSVVSKKIQLASSSSVSVFGPPYSFSIWNPAVPSFAREAIDRGHVTLRIRDDLPYGLAIFDERFGIGGYDETTGLMEVFVDADEPIACEWADRVYASIRMDSEPLDESTNITRETRSRDTN